MTSPFEILDVAEQATDAEIKDAYLQKVRSNPPDRDPAVFQRIQEAYETIKDENSRLNYALFNFQSVDFDGLLNRAFRQQTPLQPFSIDDFFKLLTADHLEKLS
jgi:curved DNA-binding protein CbpA